MQSDRKLNLLVISHPNGYIGGKVGSGFDQKTMANVLASLKNIPEASRVVDEKPLDNANTTWIQPDLYCEVEYASITPNGTYREPVFIRLRPDITFLIKLEKCNFLAILAQNIP